MFLRRLSSSHKSDKRIDTQESANSGFEVWSRSVAIGNRTPVDMGILVAHLKHLSRPHHLYSLPTSLYDAAAGRMMVDAAQPQDIVPAVAGNLVEKALALLDDKPEAVMIDVVFFQMVSTKPEARVLLTPSHIGCSWGEGRGRALQTSGASDLTSRPSCLVLGFRKLAQWRCSMLTPVDRLAERPGRRFLSVLEGRRQSGSHHAFVQPSCLGPSLAGKSFNTMNVVGLAIASGSLNVLAAPALMVEKLDLDRIRPLVPLFLRDLHHWGGS